MTTASKSRSLLPALLHSSVAVLLALAASQPMAASVTLCAERYTQDLPLAPATPMWGYRQVAAEADCATAGTATSPGPVIVVPPADTSLTITLVNRLPVPTSIVIAAQNLPTDGSNLLPAVLAADLVGAACTPNAGADPAAPDHPQNCRVRSFTGETDAGASRTYTFSNLRPGTYLYQSGTHPQVQVQMGLYGLMKHDAAIGQLFAGAAGAFDADVPVVLSEVDPVQHATIDATLGTAGNQGAWKAGGNSTLNYAPRYFLINGKVFNGSAPTANDLVVSAPSGSQRIALRIANAGLASRVLMLNQGTLKLLTEDGYPYVAAREQASALLPAGKTTDALITRTVSLDTSVTDRSVALFDRRGGTDNFDGTALGGQVARLAVTSSGAAANRAPIVNAGADQLITALSTTLLGTATDDGLNAPLVIGWSQVSGPGSTTFTPATSATASASFTVAGRYTLRLSAYDGEFTVTDDVVVTINTPPVVNAGADQTIATGTTTLTGSVTDDGFPAAPTTSWSLVSGPAGGTATFSAPTATTTGVTFSVVGTYTLRLTASDGQLSATDDVVVTITPSKHVGDLDQASLAIGTLPWSTTVTIRVHNAVEGPVQGAVVTGTWSGGGSGGTTCTTNAAGNCTVVRLAIPYAQTSNTFTVTGVTGAAAAGAYNAALNHDPDAAPQASTGTVIVVSRP